MSASAVHWAFAMINGCSYFQIISAIDFQDRKSQRSELLEGSTCLLSHHIPSIQDRAWPIEGAQ